MQREKPTALPLLHTPSQLTLRVTTGPLSHPQERAREHAGRRASAPDWPTRGLLARYVPTIRNEWTEAPETKNCRESSATRGLCRAHPSGSKPHYGAEATHSYMSSRSCEKLDGRNRQGGPLGSKGEKGAAPQASRKHHALHLRPKITFGEPRTTRALPLHSAPPSSRGQGLGEAGAAPFLPEPSPAVFPSSPARRPTLSARAEGSGDVGTRTLFSGSL